MTSAEAIPILVEKTQQHVAALDSLAAGMTAGLHAGMVDTDHMYTLMTTQTRAINIQLEQIATAVERAALQTRVNDSDRSVWRSSQHDKQNGGRLTT